MQDKTDRLLVMNSFYTNVNIQALFLTRFNAHYLRLQLKLDQFISPPIFGLKMQVKYIIDDIVACLVEAITNA